MRTDNCKVNNTCTVSKHVCTHTIELYHDNEDRPNSSVKDTTICTLPEMKENKRGIFINVFTV